MMADTPQRFLLVEILRGLNADPLAQRRDLAASAFTLLDRFGVNSRLGDRKVRTARVDEFTLRAIERGDGSFNLRIHTPSGLLDQFVAHPPQKKARAYG